MNLRFGLAAILLILEGNHVSSKTTKNTTWFIGSSPFLQPLQVTLTNAGSNPFLQQQLNQRPSQPGMPNIFLPNENQSISVPIFANSNPHLNFGIHIKLNSTLNMAGTYAPVPVTQAPYRPPPVTQAPYRPPSVTQAPYRPPPVTQEPYRPPPDTSTFTTSTSHTPIIFPDRIEPPASETPSLLDLVPLNIGLRKTKSQSKCEEYMKEIAGTADITSLVGMSTDVIEVTNAGNCRDANTLVIGGTDAKISEFPHMVALGKRNSDGTFTLMCGGTLISHTWVLSAAHCTYGPNGSPSDARMGFHKLTDQQSTITIEIKIMIRHPDYKPPALYSDIALVQLVRPVAFNTTVGPACLYQQYGTVPTSAWVSGWGVTTEFAEEQSDILQKAQLDLIDNLACTIRYNSSKEVPYGITPSMICAGDPMGDWGKDACQGDSGGPLQVIHPKNQCFYQVIGIVSFGESCASPNSPGVYTRVSHYLPWIESIVWP